MYELHLYECHIYFLIYYYYYKYILFHKNLSSRCCFLLNYNVLVFLQFQSASESCSSEMNSSPLNPDAPVFVPGSVVGVDKLLAESPRKPVPMDDIDLPDVAQFQTEAVIRPADLLDLDNSDQLNGHHVSVIQFFRIDLIWGIL